MQRLDRILAVVDSSVDRSFAAGKAASLARATGAVLELFACEFEPALSAAPFFDTDALGHAREQTVAARRRSLEGLADGLRRDGVEVTTEARWDHPAHQGIVRRVAEVRPDLVVKDTHHHTLLRRALYTNTDWNLVRTCPAPLLLVQGTDWPRAPHLLAALDPTHAHAKPAALDDDILDAAQLLARALGGDVEAVHAFFPAAMLAATAGLAGLPPAGDVETTDLLRAEQARRRTELLELVAAHGLDAAALTVLQGAATELLPRYAGQRQAAMLVMGGVSRGRIREWFVGSTAERVLDRLPCDVLVVKPPDFCEKLPF